MLNCPMSPIRGRRTRHRIALFLFLSAPSYISTLCTAFSPFRRDTDTLLSFKKHATSFKTVCCLATKQEEDTSNNFNLRPGSLAAATAEQGRVPYGESSRKYRRTVFGHDDWVQHRSSDRFAENLKGMFFSGIVRQIQKQVLAITIIGASVVLWNEVLCHALVQLPSLSLPSLPFTLSSPALGLLLVFRTNASYGRWMEGRKTWSRIMAQSVNIVRMAATFTDASSGQESLDALVRATWAFPRCLVNALLGSDDDDMFENEMTQVFGNDDAFLESILSCPKDRRPVVSMMNLSLALDAIPIDEKRRVEIDKSIVIMGDCTSACERIFSSPVPLVYTRHTARFLTLWMILLPFALYDIFENTQQEGWIVIPAVAMLSVFLFGIEELSVQLEEPFTIMPLQKFCDDIKSAAETMRDIAVKAKT